MQGGGGQLHFKKKKLLQADARLAVEVERMEARLEQARARRRQPVAGPGAPRWRASQPSKVTGLDPSVVRDLSRLLPQPRYPGTAGAEAAASPLEDGTGSRPQPAGAPFNKGFGQVDMGQQLEVITPEEQQRQAARREAERLAAKQAKAAKEREWAEGQLKALQERARQRQQARETGHARAWAVRRPRPLPPARPFCPCPIRRHPGCLPSRAQPRIVAGRSSRRASLPGGQSSRVAWRNAPAGRSTVAPHRSRALGRRMRSHG